MAAPDLPGPWAHPTPGSQFSREPPGTALTEGGRAGCSGGGALLSLGAARGGDAIPGVQRLGCGLRWGWDRARGRAGCSGGLLLLLKRVVWLGLRALWGRFVHTPVLHLPAFLAWRRPGATARGQGSWLLLWLCLHQCDPGWVFPGGWRPGRRPRRGRTHKQARRGSVLLSPDSASHSGWVRHSALPLSHPSPVGPIWAQSPNGKQGGRLSLPLPLPLSVSLRPPPPCPGTI